MIKLGIIAGDGELPNLVAKAYHEQFNDNAVIASITNASLAHGSPFRIGEVGAILDYFQKNQVSHIIMIGGVTRPKFSELKVDYKGATLLGKIMLAGMIGDDKLLRIVAQFLENEGFQIISPTKILQNYTMQKGVITTKTPSKNDMDNIALGMNEARNLGSHDIGQAVIVLGNVVKLMEDSSGTNNLIQRFGKLKVTSGILVKAIKPTQDERLDIPTIGPETVAKAIKAGIMGIAIEAGKVIVVNQQETLRLANERGIFIIGV